MNYGRKPKKLKKEVQKSKVRVTQDKITYGRRVKKSYFEDEDISIGRV